MLGVVLTHTFRLMNEAIHVNLLWHCIVGTKNQTMLLHQQREIFSRHFDTIGEEIASLLRRRPHRYLFLSFSNAPSVRLSSTSLSLACSRCVVGISRDFPLSGRGKRIGLPFLIAQHSVRILINSSILKDACLSHRFAK